MITNPHDAAAPRHLARLLAAAVLAGALGACSSTGGEGDPDSAAENDAPGIRLKSGEDFFGLDYTVDPETGMMKNENSREFGHNEFYSGEGAVKTNEHFSRSSRYATSAYGDAADRYRTKEQSTPAYRKSTSRYHGRTNRASSRQALDGSTAYGAEQYSTSPYQRGAEMMQTGAYAPAADSQTGSNRPDGSAIRSPRAGDQGPMMRDADAMTVEDVQAVLSKP